MSVHCLVEETIKLHEPTRERYLSAPLQCSNAYAHAMRVLVVNDDGTPADLSNVGVTGWLKRSDNMTVGPMNGTVSGNVSEVILEPLCYASVGAYTFSLDLSEDGETRTAMKVRGFVDKNVTDVIVDPGTPVSNIEQSIGSANAAAAAANTAAAAANTAAQAAQQAAESITTATVAETKTYLGIT